MSNLTGTIIKAAITKAIITCNKTGDKNKNLKILKSFSLSVLFVTSIINPIIAIQSKDTAQYIPIKSIILITYHFPFFDKIKPLIYKGFKTLY